MGEIAIITVEEIALDTDRVLRKCQQLILEMRKSLFVAVTKKPDCLLSKRKDQTKVYYISNPIH